MQRLLSIALLLSMLGGCYFGRSAVNEPIDATILSKLQPGSTTAKQAVELLGAPSEVVQLGNRTAYRYDFTVAKRAAFSLVVLSFLNEDTCADRAWFFFDAKDVLTHAGSTLQAKDASFAMPWQSSHGG